MKFSLNWLKEFVPDFNYNDKTKETLELCGLEIENEIKLELSFKNVVIGEILEIVPHPKKKNLLLTSVKVLGADTSLKQIVCGAHNIKKGDKIPVALPGSIINHAELETKEIAGVLSEGMLLSLKELGFPEEYFPKSHEGILILKGVSEQDSIVNILSLPDVILEIKVFPNRSDLLSIYGMARELSTILNIPLSKCFNYTEPSELKGPVKLEIENYNDCSFYSATVIEELQVTDSPSSIQVKLLKSGSRPINNLVDITNYVMLELGQPLHAFDYRSIQEDTIQVRRGKSWGENLMSLDNSMKLLDDGILVIATAHEAIGIAGIIGGLGSGIQENTSKILLESAHFSPEIIRSGRRKLSISTDASYRFERDLDPYLAELARSRAIELIQGLCYGVISGTTTLFKKPLQTEKIITFSATEVNNFLGTELTIPEIEGSLRNINYELSNDTFIIKSPAYRRDLEISQDIYEEVGRITGYNKIPGVLPPITSVSFSYKKSLEDNLRSLLVHLGFTEVMNSSLVSDEDISLFEQPLKLINPLSKDMSLFRSSLLPGILKTAINNIKYGTKNITIFEIGHVYRETEKSSLAFLFTGELFSANWLKANIKPDFYYLSGVINRISEEFDLKIQIDDKTPDQINMKSYDFFHPFRRALIIKDGKQIGYLGEINPLFIVELKPQVEKLFLAEMFIDFSCQPEKNIFTSYYEPSRYPSVEWHLSLTFPPEVNYRSIREKIESINIKHLENFNLIDLFTNFNDGNKTSYTFSFTFRSINSTLTDTQVKEEIDKIINYCKSIGGELRGNI
ncbi:MAG: Phenylalanine--tRNA ligase beta subunit [candidate division WS2 bacterium]|nr:Phenylalanine--tRNA ligase beta subunit [Candidatus Lithacetigena glycinireducens]